MYSESRFTSNIPNMFISRNCLQKICNPYVFGYISTIGVVDEFRKLGAGRLLIEKTIGIMKKKENCVGLFLHVIEHNQSAIRFYKKINFLEGGVIQNYYTINDAKFDAFLFFKVLRRENDKLFKLNYKNEKESDCNSLNKHVLDIREQYLVSDVKMSHTQNCLIKTYKKLKNFFLLPNK